MPIINFSQPFSIFVGVVLFVLVLYLAKTNKKAFEGRDLGTKGRKC